MLRPERLERVPCSALFRGESRQLSFAPLDLAHATTASQSEATPSSPPRTFAPQSLPPPQPARWSQTNRIFNFNFRSSLPRAPASRLWNPINSSPRNLTLPNVPVQHPQIVEGLPKPTEGRDEYPLLTLPEQRRSRQSIAPSSLVVERSTGGESGRTSIGLPRDRKSLAIESAPSTPKLPMPMEQIAARAAGVEDTPIPSPKPDDSEAGPKLKSQASRASLPLSRQQSIHSQRRSLIGSVSAPGEGDGDNDSEYAWGPSHPCFPHLNPHVPLSSPLYNSTRIIRIKRDWMVAGDLAPTFANLYPQVLDPVIPEEAFRDIIKKVNDELLSAFSPTSLRAWIDSLMGVATLWLWDDVGMSAVKRELEALERWLEDWNQNIGAKEGVKIIPLRRTGYLTLDIQIPDPHIGLDINNASRPATQNDEATSAPPAPQIHGDFGPSYPVPPRGLNLSGHQHPPAIEGRS